MNLLVASLAPVALVIGYVYRKDKYEKEPRHLLVYSFLLGAFVSVILTFLLNAIFGIFLHLENEYSILEQFVQAFVVVALIEEFSKYVIVRYYSQPKAHFNEPFDGIIYAVMVSMGFAASENILYVFQGGLQTAALRAFTAVPAHAVFGIIMGYFMGKAKFNGSPKMDNLMGLFLAIIFHGFYDFFLFIDFIPGIWVFAFISLIVGLILARKAIRIHQENSFFKDFKNDNPH